MTKMTLNLTLLFLLLFSLFSTKTQAQDRNYNISISVKGMENKIGILAYYYSDKRYVKDTIYFNEKGVADIKGKKNIPSGVYLIAFPSMRYNSFDIIINENDFSLATDTFNLVKNMTVKNSSENKEMYEDMSFMLPLGQTNDALMKKIKTLQKEDPEFIKTVNEAEKINDDILKHRRQLAKKYPANFYTKLINIMLDIEVPEAPRNPDGSLIDTFYNFHYTQGHYFDNIDFSDSGYIRSPVFQNRLLKYFDNYTFPQPDSIIKNIDYIISKAKVNPEMYQFCVNELFLKYAKSEIMGQDAIYVYMADKYFLSGLAWWADPSKLKELKERIESIKPTLIGKPAPNFYVQDTLGKSFLFHDFVPKNRYTILVFWNSDCGHCQKEIPLLKNIYQDSLRDMGVRVFSVSTEQTDSTFRAFAAKNCANDWIVCADMRGASAFRKEYDIIATPKLFVITQDYKIIAKNIPVEKLADFIKFEEELRKKKER